MSTFAAVVVLVVFMLIARWLTNSKKTARILEIALIAMVLSAAALAVLMISAPIPPGFPLPPLTQTAIALHPPTATPLPWWKFWGP